MSDDIVMVRCDTCRALRRPNETGLCPACNAVIRAPQRPPHATPAHDAAQIADPSKASESPIASKEGAGDAPAAIRMDPGVVKMLALLDGFLLGGLFLPAFPFATYFIWSLQNDAGSGVGLDDLIERLQKRGTAVAAISLSMAIGTAAAAFLFVDWAIANRAKTRSIVGRRRWTATIPLVGPALVFLLARLFIPRLEWIGPLVAIMIACLSAIVGGVIGNWLVNHFASRIEIPSSNPGPPGRHDA